MSPCLSAFPACSQSRFSALLWDLHLLGERDYVPDKRVVSGRAFGRHVGGAGSQGGCGIPAGFGLEIRDGHTYVNIERYGNTSAASIPIALDELNRAGRIAAGDVLLFSAFGAGLTWGAAVVRW